LTEQEASPVADASAIINLNASGMAADIIRVLPQRLVVVDVVLQELEYGRAKGRRDAELLRGLIDQGLVGLVALAGDAEEHFERLVVGAAQATLDDGEAATIAHAIVSGGAAVIDERKAKRLCALRYPNLVIHTTVDVLAAPGIEAQLGKAALADCLFNALQQGRMRVAEERLQWVIDRIGEDRARSCESLPQRIRQR
jgi:predicted nucleic acid-binding protein